jgi:ankyrin repeat protein
MGTALLDAARQGNVPAIEQLLQDGAVDLNEREGREHAGCTALHCAAQGGHEEALRLLLEGGCDPNLSDEAGDTALLLACSHGHSALVQALLTHDAAIDLPNRQSGATPLITAVQQGSVDVVKVLLRAGAATDLRTNGMQTALAIAAQQQNSDTAALLLASGASLDMGESDNEQQVTELKQFLDGVPALPADESEDELGGDDESNQMWRAWRHSDISLHIKLVDVQPKNEKLLSFLSTDRIAGCLWSESAFESFNRPSGMVCVLPCVAETTIQQVSSE